ncbi:MAG: flagellar hook-associated protein FlgK [Bryobacteraceae bacterium]
MSTLLSILQTSGNAMEVLQQALNVVENNVNNSSTPGYATQSLNLEAEPLNVNDGLSGGVTSGGLADSRDPYAEEQVQQQTQALGFYTAQAQTTGSIQSLFDVSGASGVSSALSSLFQAFSAWSTTPSDATAGQTVINDAGDVATAIQSLSNSLSQVAAQVDTSIGSTVTQINTIASQIQAYNTERLKETTPDPGEEAQLYSSLDNLSQLTNFTTVTQSDGTVTVLLGGGSPLVIGTQQYSLGAGFSVDANAANPESPPTAHIYDSQGDDITSQITGGQLGGLLDSRNRVLASVIGDSQQTGTLNQFASTLASTVNQILESGTVSTAAGAANGSALFTYDTANPTNAAASLSVDPSITTGQLAPVDSSGNANGNANTLAALESTTLSALGGVSLTSYFGQIASDMGQENQTATDNEQTQQQVVASATTLVNNASGVSLDAQAVNVMQFQRAYQSVAQVLTTLNNMADYVLQLVQPNN